MIRKLNLASVFPSLIEITTLKPVPVFGKPNYTHPKRIYILLLVLSTM